MLTEYCRMKNIEKDQFCLSYGGRQILDTDTPKSLGLTDGEIIDVHYRCSHFLNDKAY